jgi:CRISPR/Cas system-associated exonuclease Cas4 (RecB family)
MKIPRFSYSGLNQFTTCPAQYAAHRVLKYIPHTDTIATLYGKDVHSAAEHYVRDGTVLPQKYNYIKSYLDKLISINGDKFCEYELGIKIVDGEYVSCKFDDLDSYWVGVADLVIVDEAAGKAYIVDYKTGKSAKYADPKQLALLAAAVFLKYPALKVIKGMLLFVVSKEIIKAEYTYDKRFEIFDKLKEVLTQREVAYETGIFNTKPNGLCRQWCQATRCIHNGRYNGDK